MRKVYFSKEMYMNNFGTKTSLTKQERTYLSKTKKTQLIEEAMRLNLMVDEKLTKDQIFNLIKKYKQLNKPKIETSIDMSDLLDTLPSVPKKILSVSDYSKIRESDILNDKLILPSRRIPPGSKIIRKEEGLTKTQKTAVRKEIKQEIDRLSDLLEKFN